MIVCLPPQKTHIHTHTRVCIPPRMKTLAEATEIAVDCERKDNSHCCCVGVTHSSASSFQLSATVWERGTERNRYKVQKPADFSLSIPRLAAPVISPTQSSEPALASHTALSERRPLWRAVWQTQHFETFKWKWNREEGFLWGPSWEVAPSLLVSAVSSRAVYRVCAFGFTFAILCLTPEQSKCDASPVTLHGGWMLLQNQTLWKMHSFAMLALFITHLTEPRARWETWPQVTIILGWCSFQGRFVAVAFTVFSIMLKSHKHSKRGVTVQVPNQE